MTVAPDRLWRHFTPAGAAPIVIERGEGCYIWDSEGNRYLDALAALYCVNIGYGPYPEIAERAREQLEQLPFFTNWVGFATPPALELTEKLSELVPIDVGRIFLVSGGSEAVEAALKVARQYHRLRGEPTRYKYITRRSAYHGTTMGAISINGSPALRAQFEPLLPGCLRAPMPYRYRCPYCSEQSACTLQCADEVDGIIRNEDPSTVAAVIMEPVQNSAGSIVPPEGYFQRIREICDEHGVLLVADEVICGFGRVGDWFGSDPLRDRAGHDDHGQGAHVRVRAARRARGEREGDRAVLRRPQDDADPRDHVRRPPALVRDRAREPRGLRAREPDRRTCRR